MGLSKNKFYLKNRNLKLTILPGTFLPTATTNFLIESVEDQINDPVTLLDLGCGSGIVGLSLCLSGKVKMPIFCSDLSDAAVKSTIENFHFHNCQADVRFGSMFDPWYGKKFDVIVDDISGIAEPIAKISSWFSDVPCESGEDGTKLINNIICEAPNFLSENGRFFFPVISLSNVDSILKVAGDRFKNVTLLARNEWPLLDDLKIHQELLHDLANKGLIKLTKKFGMFICYTEIYMAYND